MKKYIPSLFIFVLFSGLIVSSAQALTCTSNADCSSGQICDLSRGTGACVSSTDTSGNGSTDTTANGVKVSGKIDNPLAKVGVGSIQDLLTVILNSIIIPIGGIIAVLAFIYSGFQYVMAQGDENKIATAHRTLLYTAIGTAVLLGSAVIANVLTATVNQLK